MKLILIVFTVIELLFILCNDVPFITNSSSNAIWNDKGFFILHLLILFVCITGFWLIKILYKYENIYKLVICILTILLLSLVAIINIIEETNLKLDYMSTHDPLTALLNRKSFRTQVAEKMNIINKKQSFLILIDIDHFKYINDKFGHPIGDIVLKEISNILMKYIKANDLAARWGDEEFLVFLFETSTDEAYNITNKIRLIE